MLVQTLLDFRARGLRVRESVTPHKHPLDFRPLLFGSSKYAEFNVRLNKASELEGRLNMVGLE